MITLSLDDLMLGQSIALAKSVRGAIDLDRFIEVSLGLVKDYITLHRQAHNGELDIDEIVKNIREYKYDGRVEPPLDQYKLIGEGEGRHLALMVHLELARWYTEFFVKYYFLTNMEDMEPYFGPLKEKVEKEKLSSLSQTITILNHVVRESGIKDAEKYLVGIPQLPLSDAPTE